MFYSLSINDSINGLRDQGIESRLIITNVLIEKAQANKREA